MSSLDPSKADATEVDDIEVYASGLSLEAITDWLNDTFDTVVTVNSGKVVHDMEVTRLGNTIPVMIVENAVGKAWASIWFKTKGTPWQDDTQCARSLQAYGQCRVRCNSGPWQEGADMDEWWQLDEHGQEKLIKWPNAS
ncbi:hypothetical protein J7438_07305 [Thalassotalea sp. G20_0]|uniref:hypothetical protein n=1 Tax=Thalassotalea sp. G20_0 TaxID=2821093 RepID=UPI001ADB2D40|nr:hypothetical protein [Thalassotalea sp. G20_0]MBO9493893.1 hypothetical protein [Thalassotalea sp. G20_0]